MQYPGQIKVTVIREIRSIDYKINNLSSLKRPLRF